MDTKQQVIFEAIVDELLKRIKDDLFGDNPVIEADKPELIEKIVYETVEKFIQEPEYQQDILETVTKDLGIEGKGDADTIFESASEEQLQKLISKTAEVLEHEIIGSIIVERAVTDDEYAQKLIKEAFLIEDADEPEV